MNKLFFLLLFAAAFLSIYPQDLPNYLTDREKELLKNYRYPVNRELAAVPPSPVRTMAEWEELQGITIAWTSFTPILRQIVDYAQEEGEVFILCTDSNTVKNYLTSGGVPLTNVKYYLTSFNSIWCRDYGPWCVYTNDADSMYIIDWIYNRPRPLDDVTPVFIAQQLGVPIYQTTVAPNDLTHTGGNFMADGNGTGFSSKLILNENSGKTEAQIDTIMKNFMGIKRYIKMNTLPYDEIHHIDMHIKLLDEETLLVGQYPAGVADGPQIEANLQYILNNFQTCYGRPYKVIRIPMPPGPNGSYPDDGGDYRTYTNSLILNKTVIVPTYAQQYDTTALRIYREAMPGYKIVGIDCNSIIPSLGAIHCITKEIGVYEPVFISHAKIEGTISNASQMGIKSYIKTRSGVSNAYVYWSADTSQGYNQIQMTETAADTFSASIPFYQNGKIFYYISAVSNSGRTVTKPIVAPSGVYSFNVEGATPAEIITISAITMENKVTLEWATATETNNKGFAIERASSPPFKEWNTIGFIKGNGTTTEIHQYSFTDIPEKDGKFRYRLKQIDFDGSYKYSREVESVISLPLTFALEQNYPNPFNPSTKIKYTLAGTTGKEKAVLKVYNMLGKEVVTLVNEDKEPGTYEAVFNVPALFASGVYIYRLQYGANVSIKKMILQK